MGCAHVQNDQVVMAKPEDQMQRNFFKLIQFYDTQKEKQSVAFQGKWLIT
jgi:hypothetical protein